METANPTVIAPAPTATPVPSAVAVVTQNKTLQGSVLVLIQFDVCEEIRLDALRYLFEPPRQVASLMPPPAQSFRSQRPPLAKPPEPQRQFRPQSPSLPRTKRY